MRRTVSAVALAALVATGLPAVALADEAPEPSGTVTGAGFTCDDDGKATVYFDVTVDQSWIEELVGIEPVTEGRYYFVHLYQDGTRQLSSDMRAGDGTETFEVQRVGAEARAVLIASVVQGDGSGAELTELDSATVTVGEACAIGPQPEPKPEPPKVKPPMKVKVQAIKNRSKLRVDVDPNRGSAAYRIKVQKKQGNKWKTKKTTLTRGPQEKRTINMPRGEYRVVVPPQYGYPKTISKKVFLRR